MSAQLLALPRRDDKHREEDSDFLPICVTVCVIAAPTFAPM